MHCQPTVIAGLVPAIHRWSSALFGRACHARIELQTCGTMDCRNKSGNDNHLKFSPSARSDGGVPAGGGGV